MVFFEANLLDVGECFAGFLELLQTVQRDRFVEQSLYIFRFLFENLAIDEQST